MATNRTLKLAVLANDNREIQRKYDLDKPFFGTAPQALLEGFALLGDRVEVHVVSCLQRMPRQSPVKLADNIFYHPLHVPKVGWLRTGYQGCVRSVRRKLHELRPDIVHGQGTERDCAMCAVFSGFPNVLTIHGVMRVIHKVTKSSFLSYYWFAKHLETIALKRTYGIISISPYVDALVSQLASQTWFVPNALQSFFFDAAPLRARRPGLPRFVNVGVISPRKRQLELLQSLCELRAETPFQITFIGKTDGDSDYARKFKIALQTAQVRYGGFTHCEHLSDVEFRDLYDDSDAMLHFSLEESFGLTFAEALARHLPLFASDVGAIRQISAGVNICRIFGAHDFTDLIVALRQWIQSHKYLEARAATPNSIIATRYHPRVIAAKHLEVYKAVLSEF